MHKTTLALGADIKSRFCILKGGKVTFSREFGNLADLENFDKFKKAVLRNKTNLNVVAYDLHPEYFSTRIAEYLKAKKKIAIQHHHAHIASALFSRNIKKPVIGVAFDGTGYGTDGNIWGGEFMVVESAHFKRIAHFEYLGMPGGEIAVKQPWRMAFSLIYSYLGKNALKDLEFLKLWQEKDKEVLIKMLKNNINCPLTSSVGRLFDAVSSILGICHKVSHEAEAAIKLEKIATRSLETGYYEFDILENDKIWVISHKNLVKGLLQDIKNDLPKEGIAKKFHSSLANLISKVVDRISRAYNLKDVVLSGGVFANKLLFNQTKEKLANSGYNLIINNEVPVNDLSICLGQAYIASHSK